MEANCNYPGEISSPHANQGCDHDISKLSKKRKFLDGTSEQLSFTASKYTCCETLVEHDPFSKESQQAKVFCTHVRRERMSLEGVDEDTLGADSAQESSVTVEDSFSSFSENKPDGYAKPNSCDGSALSYSSSGIAIARNGYSYTDCTTSGSIAASDGRECTVSPYEDIEFDDNGICEDELDEFGHCLGYLVSACDNNGKQQMGEELEDLSMNGMVRNSYPLLSEGLTANEQVPQLSTRKPTIDEEFEDYFSTLMI